MGKTWEEMCQEVVIDGRPGDVASAALGWQELLKNLGSVKESLETNIKDLGTVWKGEAYEAFKTRIEGHAKEAGRMIEDAEKGDGIVLSLNNAANKLTDAQREFPIPATCVNDVLEARNGKLTLGVGFFEAKVAPDFLGFLDPIGAVVDWINDRSAEAAQVYAQVGNDYQNQAPNMPGETGTPDSRDTMPETPDLDDGGGGNGRLPNTADLGNTGRLDPSLSKIDQPDIRTDQTDPRISQPDPRTTKPDLGTGYNPDTGGSTPGYGSVPGTGGLDSEYGSGLAGAGNPGLGSGLGSGGLPSTSGLGSGAGLAGGGAGAGSIPGGGALGRPVVPTVPPMMGGAAAGGKGAGGRLGGGGRLGAGAGGGMGGMAGGMAGGAGGGRGAGAGGRGAGGAGARGAGAGRGGFAGGVGPGGAGAGYGEEETPRNTWLEEDDDVWGTGGDGAPGVLH